MTRSSLRTDIPRIITERAIIARSNRVLAKEGLRLCKCRQNSRWHYDLGDFYLVNNHNVITGTGFNDLEDFARELKVLREGEKLAA